MKELKATLKLFLGLGIFSLFIHLLTIGEMVNYFSSVLLALLIIFVFIILIHYIIRSPTTLALQNAMKKPLEIVLIFGHILMPALMISIILSYYFVFCLIIANGLINFILWVIIPFTLTTDTNDYIKITLTVTLAVLLNKPLKYFLYLPLQGMFKEPQLSTLKTTIDYILNQKNIRFLIYTFYIFIVALSSLDTFQNTNIFNNLSDSNVILKSFATFIALDKGLDLLTKIDFKSSDLFNKFKELFEMSKKID